MAAELTLTISALDKASAVFAAVGEKVRGFGDTVKSGLASAMQNFTQFHFIVTDALALLQKAFASVEQFASFAEVREQLNAMAGQFNMTASAIVADMKRVTDGQFSIEQATRSAATALKNSLTPEMIIGLSQAAAAFNDIAGISVPEAFDRLAEAVQKGSERAAAAIVGKDGLGDAMKAVEESATDAERSTALYEAIMAKTAATSKIFGEAQQTLGDKIDATKATIDDAKLSLNKYVTEGILVLVSAVQLSVSGLEKLWAVLLEIAAMKMRMIPFMKLEADALKLQADAAWADAAAMKEAAGKTWELFRGIVDLDKQTAAAVPNQLALASAASVVAGGLGAIKTAADSIPKDVQVKVTTTYVDVRAEGQTTSAGAVANYEPGQTRFGNWGGAY